MRILACFCCRADRQVRGSAPALGVSVLTDGSGVPNNRITATGVTYDNNGNLTSGFGVAPAYDAANRLTAVWINGQTNSTYLYDSANPIRLSQVPTGLPPGTVSDFSIRAATFRACQTQSRTLPGQAASLQCRTRLRVPQVHLRRGCLYRTPRGNM
jgi:hypothetical protein